MAYQHKESFGTLFRNGRKREARHPDWTGTFMLNGKLWNIAGWDKDGRISLQVKEYQEQQQRPPQQAQQPRRAVAPKPAARQADNFEDDDLPF